MRVKDPMPLSAEKRENASIELGGGEKRTDRRSATNSKTICTPP